MLGSVTAMFPIFKKLWFLPLNKKLHDYHTRWNKINVDILRRFQEQGEDSPFTNSLFFHIAPMFAPNDDGHPNSLQDIQWEEVKRYFQNIAAWHLIDYADDRHR